jgi:cob(I)alamin adenosyltransferase
MKESKGLLLVYTGNGKGKTTAALGLVFRALGRGKRVAIVQFIKGKWKTGERLFAEKQPELLFFTMGRGFTWESEDLALDSHAAQEAWLKARELIMGGERDIVVLDEITYAVNYGFIDGADVLAAFRARPEHVSVVVTGRDAPEPIVALADLVTEMTQIKHPYEKGVPAMAGIDF